MTRSPRDRAGPFDGWGLKVHAAARVAQRGIATRLECPSYGLAEDMGEASHLRHESQPPAPDLTDGAAPQKHALHGG